MPSAISKERMDHLHAYWRAANYLSAGQIYLRTNPLLRQPLDTAHIKPRLLGHWGTSPGINLVYAHLNRLIQDTDAQVLLVVGPGHGGPAVRANVFLEGVMSETYPDLGMDLPGLERFMRELWWPGGVAGHVRSGARVWRHAGGETGT